MQLQFHRNYYPWTTKNEIPRTHAVAENDGKQTCVNIMDDVTHVTITNHTRLTNQSIKNDIKKLTMKKNACLLPKKEGNHNGHDDIYAFVKIMNKFKVLKK
jgi:hypothetical protein